MCLGNGPAYALVKGYSQDLLTDQKPASIQIPNDVDHPQLLAALYKKHQNTYIWLSENKLSIEAEYLIQVLKETSLHYSGELPYRLNEILEKVHYLPAPESEMKRLDVYLSDAFVNLAKDVITGHILPNKNERDHPAILSNNKLSNISSVSSGSHNQLSNIEHLLHQWFETYSLEDIINMRLAPGHNEYLALRSALNHYIQLSQFHAWPRLKDLFSQKELHSNNTGTSELKLSELSFEQLETLAYQLRLFGDLPSNALVTTKYMRPRDFNFSASHSINHLHRKHAINTNNAFNQTSSKLKTLTSALKQFQKRHGLKATGKLTALTLQQLSQSPKKHIKKIAMNMNRWRYLPQDLGNRYIMTNMANYSLSLMEANKSQLDMKVIIGKTNRRTPIMVQNLKTLVINPTWSIPPRIARESFLPYAFKNPKTLDYQGIEIVRGSGKQRKVFDTQALNWESLNVNRFPYRLEQKPGKRNILGEVKYPLDNDFAIYLHDTSEPELFNKQKRALSSGCVRIEKPRALTEALLKYNKGWNSRRIARAHKRRKNYYVSLKDPIPVYLMYWTSWVDQQGKVHFRDDVYHRDTPKKYVSWNSEPKTIAHLADE